MQKRLNVIIVLTTLLISGNAFAQGKRMSPPAQGTQRGFGTGRTWREMSQEQRQAFVMGYIDALLLHAEKKPYIVSLFQWLTDNLFDTEQLSAMITIHVEAHPEQWNDPLSVLVWNALNESRRKNQSR